MKKLLLILALSVCIAVPFARAASLVYFKANLTATVVKVNSGTTVTLGTYNAGNTNSSAVYVQVFNAATTGAVTLGTTPPTFVLTLPASGVLDGALSSNYTLSLGMVIAVTTTPTGNTAPTNAVPITVFYSASQ